MDRRRASPPGWMRVRFPRDSSLHRLPAQYSSRLDTSATTRKMRRGGRWAGLEVEKGQRPRRNCCRLLLLKMDMEDGSDFSVCVQKFPTDKAYFIAKELLTTERTYLKDLQVITEVIILMSSLVCSRILKAASLPLPCFIWFSGGIPHEFTFDSLS